MGTKLQLRASPGLMGAVQQAGREPGPNGGEQAPSAQEPTSAPAQQAPPILVPSTADVSGPVTGGEKQSPPGPENAGHSKLTYARWIAVGILAVATAALAIASRYSHG